jgi:hypothetical protein
VTIAIEVFVDLLSFSALFYATFREIPSNGSGVIDDKQRR